MKKHGRCHRRLAKAYEGSFQVKKISIWYKGPREDADRIGCIDRHTKPGGWVEFQDLDIEMYSEDGSFTDDLDLKKWNSLLIEGYRKLAREPCPGPRLKGWLKEAGFEDVTHSKYKMPVGPWAKDKYHVCYNLLTTFSDPCTPPFSLVSLGQVANYHVLCM